MRGRLTQPQSKLHTTAKTFLQHSEPVTALYDGHCSLCIQAKVALSKLDVFRAIRFENFRDSKVLERFPKISESAAHAEIHVIAKDGKIDRGFDGFRYLTRYLPPFWPILPFLYLPGARWVGSRAYEWLARRRFLFGGAIDSEQLH